jgi:hypothetical protein
VNDDHGHYCHSVEAYLCRKNDGHLIRIVGPAFEQVCGWAARGVPLNAVFRGIDRYVERYYAKGPRRRPVRVEFCEADVLDVFDEWRRAIGVTAVTTAEVSAGDADADAGDVRPDSRKRGSLPAHLERVVARLAALRPAPDAALETAIDGMIRELDTARSRAKSARGDTRAAFLDRLRELDGHLIDVARAGCDADVLGRIGAEADLELAPFRSRLSREAYERAREACISRLVREERRLPVVTFE